MAATLWTRVPLSFVPAADLDHWPSAGTFGSLPDTNPYGNYAGGIDMYYPTYSEGAVQDMYWTRT
jgi:hypothetical protein